LVLPTSNLELPISRVRPYPPLRNLFVPMHLETKLRPRKNPPLSKPFRISILQDFEPLRPYAPLRKFFVFNTVSKTLQKAPMSNSCRSKCLQTAKKAPLSKSFRITVLQEKVFSHQRVRSFAESFPACHAAAQCEMKHDSRSMRLTKKGSNFLGFKEIG